MSYSNIEIMKDEFDTISVDLKFIVKPTKDLPAAIRAL